MSVRIPLLPPDISEAVLQKFNSRLSAHATVPAASLSAFQKEMKTFFPAYAVLGLNSGTAALHLGLQVLGVKAGDFVLCPTFTFAATVNAILYLDAIPILIDSEMQTWNMDPGLLEQALKELDARGRKPTAILLVHAYGTPAQIRDIRALASAFQVPLLEDAAAALGSYYDGQMAGSFGEMGAFSFNYNKIITTAGGGMLISKSEGWIKQADFLANQAREEAPYYLHSTTGFNYRMSGLAAELGFAQLPFFQEKLLRKKAIYNCYKNQLENHGGITFQELPGHITPNHWLTSFLLANETGKEKVYRALQSAGIECRMLWRPMHLQPAYRNFPQHLNGVAEELFQRGLSLPSGISLTEREQTEITARVLSCC